MELNQLRSFIAVCEEMHFGRAARNLDILPSTIGRQIQLLEASLGVKLFNRTTRSVALTTEGAFLLEAASGLLDQADHVAQNMRELSNTCKDTVRLGAIDSAASGLVPMLIADAGRFLPNLKIELLEDKSVSLIPRLFSGRIDLAIIRPRAKAPAGLKVRHLMNEIGVVAIPSSHKLAHKRRISIENLRDEPMILPERRLRPHSHDLTVKLFAEIRAVPNVRQYATEKSTILNLVAAGVGIAIVPRWTARLGFEGIELAELEVMGNGSNCLPLAAAWSREVRDDARDSLLDLLMSNLREYSEDQLQLS